MSEEILEELKPTVDFTKEIEELKTEIDNMKQKDDKNNEEWKEIENKKLKILNNISKNMSIEDIPEDNDIIIHADGVNTYFVDKNNKKLSDYEFYKRSLKLIKDHNLTNKINPQFIDYMEKYVSNVNAGGNPMEFVDREIYKKINLETITNKGGKDNVIR